MSELPPRPSEPLGDQQMKLQAVELKQTFQFFEIQVPTNQS
jgi:hypothetical protein